MIWVINGKGFEHHFTIKHKLPSHKSTAVKNCRIHYNKYGNKIEICDVLKNGRYHEYSLLHIQEFLDNYDDSRMYSYQWNYKRKSWRYAKKMKLIDFGNDYLYQLMHYNDSFECVKLWSKREFIERALNPRK